MPSTLETWVTATQLRAPFEQRREGVHVEQPLVVDRRPVDLGPDPLGQLLPGDDVGVVLHLGEHDAVAGADVGVAPGAGDEVDRLGRVADEDHLAAVAGAEVAGDDVARPLVGGGRLGREGVGAAVDVRVVAALVVGRPPRSRRAPAASWRRCRGRRPAARRSRARAPGRRRGPSRSGTAGGRPWRSPAPCAARG